MPLTLWLAVSHLLRVTHGVQIVGPQCAKCRYSLIGLESQQCPECGTYLSKANVISPGDFIPIGRIARIMLWTPIVLAVFWVMGKPLGNFTRAALGSIPLRGGEHRIDLFSLPYSESRFHITFKHAVLAFAIDVRHPHRAPRTVLLSDNFRDTPIVKEAMVIDVRSRTFEIRSNIGLKAIETAIVDPIKAKPLTDEALAHWIEPDGRGPIRDLPMTVHVANRVLDELRGEGPWPSLTWNDGNALVGNPPLHPCFGFAQHRWSDWIVTDSQLFFALMAIAWTCGVIALYRSRALSATS